MEKENRLYVRDGNPVILGANKNSEGLNFAAEDPWGAEASLVLYRKGFSHPYREISFTEEHRTGKVCTLLVSGLDTEKFEYNFRIEGRIVQVPLCSWNQGKGAFWSDVFQRRT